MGFETVNIPGTSVSVVCRENCIQPPDCETGNVDVNNDHFTVDGGPVCPDDPRVKAALDGIGLKRIPYISSKVLSTRVLPMLFELRNGKDAVSRLHVLIGLTENRDDDHDLRGDMNEYWPAFAWSMNNDENVYVRREASEKFFYYLGSEAIQYRWHNSSLRSFKETALRVVTGAIHDDDYFVRENAFYSLILFRPLQVANALSFVLSSEPNGESRAKAAEQLGLVGTSSAPTVLIKALKTDHSASVRKECAKALSGYKGDDVVAALSEAAKKDADPDVRISAMSSMGSIGGRMAIRYLSERLKQDTDGSIRTAAAEALGNSGASDKPVADVLKTAIDNDPDIRVRSAAATALGSVLFRMSRLLLPLPW